MIRRVQPNEIADLVDVLANAYPGWEMSTAAERDRVAAAILRAQEGPLERRYYGAFRGDRLVGGMRLLDFRMNLRGPMVDAGGVGVVAVDLLHKKEHVAKELMLGFLAHYRQRSVPITLLYAFRTDFYQQMGFGLGPQAYRYKLPALSFPKGPSKSHIVRLTGTETDKSQMMAHYQQHVAHTHGLIEKTDAEVDTLFASPSRLVYGYRDEEGLQGYLVGSFEPEDPANKLSNNLHVTELFYASPAVLAEFFTFLNSQADQVQYVIFDTYDRDFYHLFGDARNDARSTIYSVFQETNQAATGLMYRVIDTRKLFWDLRDYNFQDMSMTVRLAIADSFLAENDKPLVVRFDRGQVVSVADDGPCDVEIGMDIAHFSSLIMGTISFRKLVSYGLAHISQASYIEAVHQLFYTEASPVCTTPF